MQSLRAFLSERLTAAAEEIFGAVERTIAEYKEEICRSKDLEISRLKMQLKLLKSEPPLDRSLPAQMQQLTHHPPPPEQQQHRSVPAVEPAEPQHCEEEEEEEGSSLEQEHPEPSQVKKEQQLKSHRDFWMAQDAEQLESLESDIKDFISSPSSLKGNLQDHGLPFHPYHNNHSEESRDKPYCCSVCEKRFSNCSHLAAHIRTHTGERPYRCDICRKTFITTSALNRHQTIHTEGKHFVCVYCGKSFKWMESLGRHIRSVHKRDESVPDSHTNVQ
ncbi:zinc finger and SCAN domain-containing protein 12-like [Plectropomus leopardus]|uniref:zinc finger and SCAN domain-containing protein 12-like n=1 Tax=Plectropomus leopardus TaxID=160734 RepID=UPI001C4CDF32|nr:zinc finger and SCAN domain-containing protein 12-like [Plectropomus leopardus]XP_042345343.1 zinc finger and SCAN domain-containing protein 12-like [Plectropomus leopardus]